MNLSFSEKLDMLFKYHASNATIFYFNLRFFGSSISHNGCNHARSSKANGDVENTLFCMVQSQVVFFEDCQ